MIWLQVFTPTDDWAVLLMADWLYVRPLGRHTVANQNPRRA